MSADEFCAHEEKGMRCVAPKTHGGKHVLQGKGSATVRTIERQTWQAPVKKAVPEKKEEVKEQVVPKPKDA